MKKNVIISFITGAMLFGTAGVFAGQYIATENPFPVQLNGEKVSLEGYNIEGSTYFKLRDIADVVGGFNVDFNNNTIQLSKDGYVYNNTVSSDDKLKEYAKQIKSVINEDHGVAYDNVKFMLTDVTGDGKNDLLAGGIDEEGLLAQIEVYYINNGNIEKILNDHCQGYGGGYTCPVRYNGNVYICAFNYSSGTGFLKRLLKYENGSWETAYSCHTVFDY